MRISKNISLTLFFLLLSCRLLAQTIERYNTFNYNVNEGLLQSTIIDMAYDRNNFCWISFPNGIQKFDGKNVANVPLQPGLPDDKYVLFFRCTNGDLLISHTFGISKYDINANRFTQVHTISPDSKSPAQFIGEDGDIIYIYKESGLITGLNRNSFTVISETSTGLTDYSVNISLRVKLSDNIIDHKVAIAQDLLLYLWDLSKAQMVSAPAKIEYMSSKLLVLKTGSQAVYYNYKIDEALQVYDFASRSNRSLPIKGKDDMPISRCIIFPWQTKLLISFSNKLYETDTSFHLLKSELVNFQNKPMAGMSAIIRIRQDNFGNLMVGTVNTGLVKVIRNNYPVKYYGSNTGEGNFVISMLPDKANNKILAGTTGNGLQVFDTLQRMVRHIKTLPGRICAFFG